MLTIMTGYGSVGGFRLYGQKVLEEMGKERRAELAAYRAESQG